MKITICTKAITDGDLAPTVDGAYAAVGVNWVKFEDDPNEYEGPVTKGPRDWYMTPGNAVIGYKIEGHSTDAMKTTITFIGPVEFQYQTYDGPK